MEDRNYQNELIDIVQCNNALIALPTGSGKTHIAARIIQQHHLPAIRVAKAAGAACKAVIFLAPTNPLVAQQCMMLRRYGITARAYCGDVTTHSISSWGPEDWRRVVSECDVLVMTPEVLLHVLAHAAAKMSDIALLIFDEAHHCNGDHPYAQIMEDFYHVLEHHQRPQVLALTASPQGLEGAEAYGLGRGKKKSRGTGAAVAGGGSWGLQARLDARLLTVAEQFRAELQSRIPIPADDLEPCYQGDDPRWAQNPAITSALARLDSALKDMLAPATKCEAALRKLQRQAMLSANGQLLLPDNHAAALAYFAETDKNAFGSVSLMEKQVRGTLACLQSLGPWAAAAAAYWNLLAGRPEGSNWQERLQDDEAAVHIPVEGEDEGEEGAGPQLADHATLVDLKLAKLLSDDDIGKAPPNMLEQLSSELQKAYSWLQRTSEQSPSILCPQQLAAAERKAHSSSSSSSDSGIDWSSVQCLAALAPELLHLVGKAAVLTVLSVLAELLMPLESQQQQRQELLCDEGLLAAAGSSGRRAGGGLRPYGARLLAQVPFDTLQAQVWPNLPASVAAPPWQGPPLLSPKLTALLRHLEVGRCDAGLPSGLERPAPDDWWSAIVFVETKLEALVLCKLLESCPDMSQVLRAGYLVGDTEPAGGNSSLKMNNKSQAGVVRRFRTGQLNVLIATNIGSEGMDFKQCQLVVAFQHPQNLTGYLQARGRARKAGSSYSWLVPSSPADARHDIQNKHYRLVAEAESQQQLVDKLSAETRQLLQQCNAAGRVLRYHQRAEEGVSAAAFDLDYHEQQGHVVTKEGAVATLRMAQPLLAGFCAKLPGSDMTMLLQAFYSTQEQFDGSQIWFHTTVFLPENSGVLQPISSAPWTSNSKSAKNAAALHALKELQRVGKLDDWLQPTWVSSRHSMQLAAERIPPFQYEFKLEDPLGPRTVNFSHPAEKITLHLHVFRISPSTSPQQQQHNAAGSSSSVIGLSSVLPTGVDALLNVAVGAAERCAAVPGSTTGGSSSSNTASSSSVMDYGVLLWEQLPGGASGLQWPMWSQQQQQQPHTVQALYTCPVSLTAPQLLQLLHYQHILHNIINWSNKRLLGFKNTKDLSDGAKPLRPLHPAQFESNLGCWLSPSAAADSAGSSSTLPQLAAALRSSSCGGDYAAAAAAALSGAQLCYLFVPVQQQQETVVAAAAAAAAEISWSAIHKAASGLQPATAVVAKAGLQDVVSSSSSSSRLFQGCSTAAVAAAPDQLTDQHVLASSTDLAGRVLITGHSSMLYRCTAIAERMTLSTPHEFKKRYNISAQEPAGTTEVSIGNHLEYFAKVYSVTGLRSDLPMVAVEGSGWNKGLGLLENVLKPPQLQKRGSRASAAQPRDITTAAAAAAAAAFSKTMLQQQQQHVQFSPGVKRPFFMLDGETAGHADLTSSGNGTHVAAEAAAASEQQQLEQQQQQQQRRQEYLPLELCWLLPVSATEWAQLKQLPAFMYRINTMLRVQQLHQRLAAAAAAGNSAAAAAAALPMFPVPSLSLLSVACAGTSAQEAYDLEGLEFLGDVVLKFLATNYFLQSSTPTTNEGELSVAKARTVRNVALAAAAQQSPYLQLQQYLVLRQYQADDYTPTGCYPSSSSSSRSSGDGSTTAAHPLGLLSHPPKQERGKRLADCVEALIGAVYLTAAAAAAGAAGGGVRNSVSVSTGRLGAGVPVSVEGLAAAALFCAAAGILAPDAATTYPAWRPSLHAMQQQQPPPQLSQQQQQLQQLLGYTFRDPGLLSQSLTHVSLFGTASYQRLEFLGDAIVDLLVSAWLMQQLGQQLLRAGSSAASTYTPAELTWRRGALVNNTNLGRAAAAAGLQDCLRAQSRQLGREIRRFLRAQQRAKAAAAAAGGGGEGPTANGKYSVYTDAEQGGCSVDQVLQGAVLAGGLHWSQCCAEIWREVWTTRNGHSSISSFEDDVISSTDEAPAAAAAGTVPIHGSDAAVAAGVAAAASRPVKPPKVLADLIESLVGAIFVDSASHGSTPNSEWENTWIAVQQLLPSLQQQGPKDSGRQL